eukprot:7512069-Pyramimonas_sp.AAC.1
MGISRQGQTSGRLSRRAGLRQAAPRPARVEGPTGNAGGQRGQLDEETAPEHRGPAPRRGHTNPALGSLPASFRARHQSTDVG